MSWQPGADPILGDKTSCDQIEMVIVPRIRDLGGFEVRRALPSQQRQMVGPFIFLIKLAPLSLSRATASTFAPILTSGWQQ